MKYLDGHIEITPGVAGGRPRVTGRRITVPDIVIWHERLGRSPDDIAEEYELTLAQVHAALAYYFDHRAEVDAFIEEDRTLVDTLRKQGVSKVDQRLRDLRGEGTQG